MFITPFTTAAATTRIERGDSLSVIAGKLERAGLLKSPLLFKLYTWLSGTAHLLKPGTYDLAGDLSLVRLVETLAAGPPAVTVTIKEGSTVKDIDEQLNKLKIIRPGELTNFDWEELKKDFPFLEGGLTLEGYLFPDSYRFTSADEMENIVRQMLINFETKAFPLIRGQRPEDGRRNLIIASLIERESPFYDDQVLISGVIHKRLKMDMPLQIDATVTYIKCAGQFFSCAQRALAKADYKLESSFNTYLYKGLPPAPIASPGVAALRAALNPARASHLYYLSDPATRRTYFSQTFDEHNEKRYQILKL